MRDVFGRKEVPAGCSGRIVPSPGTTLARSRNGLKRKPAMVYNPKGDLKSSIKMHGGKMKITPPWTEGPNSGLSYF